LRLETGGENAENAQDCDNIDGHGSAGMKALKLPPVYKEKMIWMFILSDWNELV